jgi:hypothetical protein
MTDIEGINLDNIKSLPLKEKIALLDLFNNRSKVKSKTDFLSFMPKLLWLLKK